MAARRSAGVRLLVGLLILSLLSVAAPGRRGEAAAQEAAAPQRTGVIGRTATSVTTANDDGTETLKVYAEPINYLDDTGTYRRRDNAVVPDDGGFRRKAGPESVRFGATADANAITVSGRGPWSGGK